MDLSPVAGGLIWLAVIALCGVILVRLRSRRRHIGSAAAGTVYDMLNEEKRNAIEIVVENKAAERDFEHAEDDKKE